jgi:hypothetical protein|tara:strand:- start:383 stop:751 length:369 start_codon:yes stop_codon:yes gene_type:complete
MKKTELHDIVHKTLKEYITEAELSTGDNTFTIKVDVNKNPTKKGIKIQLIPKGETILNDPDEKISVSEKVQSAMNKALGQYGLQVSVDADIAQATDNPNVLGYYIPISQFKNLITKALRGKE